MTTTSPCTPILIVDDMPEIRSILVRYLHVIVPERIVLAAPDAEAALELALRHRPGMLLTDFRLPDLNGVELAEQVRERLPDVYTVLMSVHNDTQLPFEKDGGLIHAFLQKPFQLTALDYLLDIGDEPEVDTIQQRRWPPARMSDVIALRAAFSLRTTL